MNIMSIRKSSRHILGFLHLTQGELMSLSVTALKSADHHCLKFFKL